MFIRICYKKTSIDDDSDIVPCKRKRVNIISFFIISQEMCSYCRQTMRDKISECKKLKFDVPPVLALLDVYIPW